MRFSLLATALLALFCAAAAAAPAPLSVQRILGARIVAAGGAPVGPVSDLLCDTIHGRIADLVVSRGNTRIVLPWTAQPSAAPATITVSAAALAQAAPVGGTLDNDPALRSVEQGLVGQAVISADGAPAGHIVGLQIDPQSGAVVDLLVASGAPAQEAKELPWSAIADIDLSPIVLNLNAQQVAALPTAAARVASD